MLFIIKNPMLIPRKIPPSYGLPAASEATSWSRHRCHSSGEWPWLMIGGAAVDPLRMLGFIILVGIWFFWDMVNQFLIVVFGILGKSSPSQKHWSYLRGCKPPNLSGVAMRLMRLTKPQELINLSDSAWLSHWTMTRIIINHWLRLIIDIITD